MAAHIITALNQTREDIKLDRLNWVHLQGALNYSCWTEDLDYYHYLDLMKIVESEDISRLSTWIDKVYPIYHIEWLTYGQPNNRENWRKVKFNLWKNENKS